MRQSPGTGTGRACGNRPGSQGRRTDQRHHRGDYYQHCGSDFHLYVSTMAPSRSFSRRSATHIHPSAPHDRGLTKGK